VIARSVIAIGCGPFNLGLAALASTIDGLDLVTFEAQRELRWHPGLMFDDAKLQLGFLADLVSLVDPTHPLSFLAYLRDVDRLYSFYIREDFHPSRREYEAYLRWAAAKLPSVRFGHRVERVSWNAAESAFSVELTRLDGGQDCVSAETLVLGVGTEPALPPQLASLSRAHVIHSSGYLHRALDVAAAKRVTVVGSGQSGAEIVLDLLRRNVEGGPAVTWLTRTPAFAPLDYTKLVLEMTTPAYVRYFHGLPQHVKDRLVAEQWQHYKGISGETLAQIHGALYERELFRGLAPVELRCGVSVEAAIPSNSGARGVALDCRQRDTGATFWHETDLVIAATGYRERAPTFLAPLEGLIKRDDKGRTRVRLDHSIELDDSVTGRIFVSNADLHSHGVAAPDLGVCAFRNGTIINAVLGREAIKLPRRTAFTTFDVASPICTTRDTSALNARAEMPGHPVSAAPAATVRQ
jgi:lysine N6-hydroxylase